jgi:hypothetical protein
MLMLVASYNVTSIAYIASDLHPGQTAWQHDANCSLRQLALDSPNGPESSYPKDVSIAQCLVRSRAS